MLLFLIIVHFALCNSLRDKSITVNI